MSERALVHGAEVALAAITVAAVLGMSRLFSGGDWIAPLLANALVAHLAVAVLRRRGMPLPVTAAVTTLLAGLVVSWTSYWSTTTVGIPTATTWSTARADLDTAWSLYQDVVAPTSARTGFVLASALALWMIAFVADWAAFRLWVPFESTLPAATLFLFTALLGTERGRTWGVAAYAAAFLLFLLLHRLARQEGTSHWVAERRASGHRSVLTAGIGLVALAVVAGSVMGPRLPGADAAGVLDPNDLDGADPPRVTISPLVDIRSRLVEQPNVEVFTVRSTARAYWRLTSLERFDGRIWSSSGSYGKADGRLPEAVPIDAATENVEQSFAVSALAAIWLPSAYEPRNFTGDGLDVRFDEGSSTLIVSSQVPTSDGLAYQVTSASPRLTPADLTGTAGQVPTEIRETYTALPGDFSEEVRLHAKEVTNGATTPYEQSLALQNHLRTFEYDLTVPPGHGGDALETFLFVRRRGYCEQFAGAFAAMARSIGLPARVAVGFTPGDVDPAQPDLYRVRGEHAHAWPEVFFSGAGWVAFEPTPGRGMPAAEPYTGVPEQQAATGSPGTATTLSPAVTAPSEPGPQGSIPTAEEPGAEGGGGGDEGAGQEPSVIERYGLDPARRAVPLLLLLAGAYLLGVPLGLLVHRRRRARQARTPSQRIELAWLEATEAAAAVGFRERSSDTYSERAEHLGDVLPTAGRSPFDLAGAREAADYSPDGAGDAEVASATGAAAVIIRAARAITPRSVGLRRWLDPRPELRAWRRGRSGTRRQIAVVSTGNADPDRERPLVGAGTAD